MARRSKIPPRIPPPIALEQQYHGQIRRCVASARVSIDRLLPRVKRLIRERDEERSDSVTETWEEILRQIGSLRIATHARVTREAPAIARAHVEQVESYQRRGLMRQVDAVLGIRVDLAGTLQPDVINNMVRQNVDLIVTVPERHFDLVQEATRRALNDGTRIETLTKRIDEIHSVSDFNAYRIARDQTSKISANIAQAQQRELGVTKYRWRTSQDERVREEHVANNGREFDWANPPMATGHPGDDIMCRCEAEPVLDDLFDGVLASQ